MPAKPIKAKEQYRLVLECRSSGLTDYQWCVEKGICPGTFYGWVRRLRQKGYENIPEPVHSQRGCGRQEVVRIDVPAKALPETFPSIAQIPAAPPSAMELSIGGCVIRVPNGTDPELMRQALCLLKGGLC
ncbi:MAG: helix-turn-helix domain containing protein [Lachnospiraceae bacterium]|nr:MULTISPECIES: helix-turn-helix domain-containing protein [Lachnospiraceae]MCX4324794.1 helix-turn-helix domain containing protein [Lachnospiraceae bacterium]